MRAAASNDQTEWVSAPSETEMPYLSTTALQMPMWQPMRSSRRAARANDLAGARSLLGWALVGAWAVFAVSTVARPTPGYNVWLDVGLYDGILVFAGLVCLGRLVTRRSDDGLAWAVIGVGLVSFAAGGVYSSVWLGQGVVPTPSLADELWWVFYATMYVGLALLLRRRVEKFHLSMLLDGAIAGLGAAALVVAFLLARVISSVSGPLHQVATDLSYPVADVLLLIIVVGVIGVFGWRLSPMWLLLAVGLVVFLVGDTVFLFLDANGAYVEGGPLDATWPLAAVLIAFASTRSADGQRLVQFGGAAVLAVPVLVGGTSIGLLVYDHAHPLPWLAVAAAAGTLALVLGRVVLTIKELRSLADSQRQARTDELTGLANRRHFYEALQAEIGRRDPGRPLTVLLLDLDRFKEINDSLGHSFGDRLLQQIGPRIGQGLRTSDLVARLGGDEFAVIVEGDDELARSVAERMLGEIRLPFLLEGLKLHVDASIGACGWPAHGLNGDELLARADVAMYAAKNRRTGFEMYEPERDRESLERLGLVEGLRAALKTDEIVLHFQPIVELSSGSVCGVEALVRWLHPNEGLLQPNRFLPIARQAGLMEQLTQVVLYKATEQCGRWRHAGLDVPVSINLAATSIHNPGLPQACRDALARYGLPPSSLILEITEDELMTDPAVSREVLQRLDSLGVRIAVDDYGTGRSSLAYLRELPVNQLKLDRSFLADLASGKRTDAIIRSTVGLAHALGFPLVAEGVETAEVYERLRAFGCDAAQGFYIARPMPGPELTPWLEERALARSDSGGNDARALASA